MQALFETVFEILYLTLVISVGIIMIKKERTTNNSIFLVLWLQF